MEHTYPQVPKYSHLYHFLGKMIRKTMGLSRFSKFFSSTSHIPPGILPHSPRIFVPRFYVIRMEQIGRDAEEGLLAGCRGFHLDVVNFMG
jgi:hypothetical protein